MAVDINSAVQSSNIRVVSFNMHGYNQGAPTVKELLNDNSIAVAMLQEH